MNICDEEQSSTNYPGDGSSSLSPPPSAAAGSERRCRQSSPLLSVLLASVGDHRDDDVNAQSILEDHLLRVWDETTAAVAVTTAGVPCRCRPLPRDDAVATADSRRG